MAKRAKRKAATKSTPAASSAANDSLNATATSNKRQKMFRTKSKGKKNAAAAAAAAAQNNPPEVDGPTMIFNEIADREDGPDSPDSQPLDVATMEGISKLCEKLDLDPFEDVRVLVLLWKLGSKEKPGQITREEWEKGCENLGIDSIEGMKKLIPSLDLGFMDREDFKKFYEFCFKFNLQGTHRTLDKEMVVLLWQMLLTERTPRERLDTFCEFVEKNDEYQKITLDQWKSFLDFCYECENLSTYDESSSAWPVLIDEYVEHMEEKQKNKK